MTGTNWKKPEIIKVLEFINKHFVLWCKSHQDACARAAKEIKINRDAKAIYSKVHSLLKAMDSPRERKACTIFKKSRKVNSLVKEINRKTKELDDKYKGKQKITSGSNVKMTTEKYGDFKSLNLF
jgi:hypothetical protein